MSRKRKQSPLNRIPPDVDPLKSGYEKVGESRYVVQKRDGTSTGQEDYFVLRLDNQGDDPIWIYACQLAARVLVETLDQYDHLPALCDALDKRLREYQQESDGMQIVLQPSPAGKKKEK
jgi:hypothetical protein